ncbi:hypothetical protein AMTRI_Chr10g226670 [Amborella trichopoda]
MGHLMPSSFMMELYFIVAILSAMAVPEASVASPSSGSSKDALQLLSFKCMDHQETVDLLICNSTPSKPNETSMQASLLILSQTLKLRYASFKVWESCIFLNSTQEICQVKVLTPRVQSWYLVMEIERPLPQD